jgi:D-serine deaminase-like pyridoxal phosphate-dependent protein
VRDGVTRDVLIANQLVGPGKVERAASLARESDLIVAVDSVTGVEALAAAATSSGVEVGALVDVNVGMPRCGVAPGAPAVELAQLVDQTAGLRLRGVMGYEGHAVGIADRPEREGRARKAMEKLLSTARAIREAGLRCEIVSAGGTGTFDISGDMEGVTEIQAGSYALMDTAYAALDIPFEKAFSLQCTVISRPTAERCVADGGLKAASTDHGNPEVKGLDGALVLYLADEHTVVTLPPDAPHGVGDSIEFWPSHIDPTINMHDVMYAVRDGEVVEVWHIAARGYVEHRT